MGPIVGAVVLASFMAFVIAALVLALKNNVYKEKVEAVYKISEEILFQLPPEELKKLKILNDLDDMYNIRQDIDDIRRHAREVKAKE